MDIEYRFANEDDAEKILDFLRCVGSETDYLSYSGHDIKTTVEEEKKFLQNADMLIAYDSKMNIIAGTLQLSLTKNKRMKHRAEIAIALRKDYWGKKVSSELMQRAIDILKERGVTKINLEVVETNKRAISFYKKMGFQEEGLDKRLFLINEVYLDGIYMGKLL